MADTTMTTDTPTNEPFTLQERIQQLCEIDTQIVSLMSHTSSALSALGAPPKTSSDPSNPSAQTLSSQTQTFKTSMDALLSTLHTVDVHMKRQILSLEEASIIKLRNDADPKTRQPVMNEDAKIVARPSLEPNGVGTIGNLDVGWLNSRNNKVEREMEAELWAKMRELLERYHAKEVEEGAAGGDVKDERMEQ
ncbi:mediator complex protein-domain-containing protein [Colletotrichum godetiae]|uniref:Mediator of RNA polymerase II transcription subunit 11 n=1 Tax=Colletotrichum godetiae TaxID=1209918 RepID=A0AAJ0AI63_9PEZI|nr:mediator complex protein-domain-containing protein [Colletotrichum godetiae]KAK1672812.1 mediator complex protein-domain-containing protein [Colletotrichum godetiae]